MHVHPGAHVATSQTHVARGSTHVSVTIGCKVLIIADVQVAFHPATLSLEAFEAHL
jgi:hypothetical protein